MIIKKCDVCKNVVDTLYDKEVVTRIDTINNVQYYKPEKLHICKKCMGSINDTLNKCSLDWYEENIKEENNNDNNPSEDTSSNNDDEPNNETNESGEQNSEDAGGTTTGE
jgi:hypothetical protein